MYCNNCGNKCKENDKFCEKCGHQLNNFVSNNINNFNNNCSYNHPKNNDIDNEETKKANILCLISACCIVSPTIIGKFSYAFENINNIISSLSGLIYLLGITLMIYVRIKYPKNIFGKVLMWVCIVGFICFAVLLLILMISCVTFLEELRSCSW